MANIVDDVGMQACLRPDALAVHEFASDRWWSYAAWNDAIARAAAVLAFGYRIEAGERVAALARNCAELLLLHLACARIGAIFAPFNWRLSQAELLPLLDNAGPSLLIGDADFLAPLQVICPKVEIPVLRAAIETATPLVTSAFGHGRPSLILYTSGTSGRPKGVLLSERNIRQTAINFGLLAQVRPGSVMLAEAPMFHVIGIAASIRPLFMQGGAVQISEGFEPMRTFSRLADPQLGVTHYFCVPQMAQMLRSLPAFDPDRLRGLTAIFSGGAPHPAANIRAWLRDGIVIADGFGMSETGTVSCMPLQIPLIGAKAGSAGIMPPSIHSRIIDDQGREVPPGTAGELLLQGDLLFEGYWRAPEETAKAFTKDGWFRTGDIAYQDEDGFLFLVDRKKDMYISGGENIYPAEIEAALAGLPGVGEAAVIGVPDARWGEVGHLAVVVAAGGPDETAIRVHLDLRLARYKIPKYISFIEALPRTGTGKIQKNILRQILTQPSGRV